MNDKRYWFPVKPARDGWGWGLPQVWQGWAVLVAFFVSLIAGETALGSRGPLVMALYGCALGGVLLGIAFWKGEPQSSRDNSSP
jgi:hypothetical protein